MKKYITPAAAVLFFIFAALYMTYPYIMHMGSMVGDPYVDVEGSYWIGEGAKIWTRPHELWNATIFYPHRETLLTNQWVIGIYLVAGPVYLLTRNPILAHNFYLLLAYFLNGLCMYFLARHLLRDACAAILAGFIFAYCPLRFSAPQLLGFDMFWICLALLSIHRFMESRRLRSEGMRISPDALLCGFFFGMEFLTDPFTGMLFALMFAMYLAYHIIGRRLAFNGDTLINLSLALAIVVVIISPLFYPYAKMMHSRGVADMTRGLEESQALSCDAVAYLVTPPSNFLYGWITKKYALSRAQYLFPGFVGGILCIVGLFRRRGSHIRESGERGFLILLGVLGILLSFGPYVSFGGRRICPGLYMLLYNYCSPFRSLRAIGWSIWLALIPFALFCGEGAALFLSRASSFRKGGVFFVAMVFLITVEYFNKNASGDYFTTRNYHVDLRVPGVYEWLKQQEGDCPVLELPMPENDGEFEMSGNEDYYMLWSLYHGKRIVNGSSSFRPPEYWPLVDMMADFPSAEAIAVIRALGVNYVIVHADWYDYNEFEHKKIGDGIGARVVRDAGQFKDDMIPVRQFGQSYVFKISLGNGHPEKEGEGVRGKEIKPGAQWKVTSSVGTELVGNMFDGNPVTSWSAFHGCNIWNNDNFVQIDFGRAQEIARLMIGYRAFREFPRGLRIEVSRDGEKWEKIDTRDAYRDMIIGLIQNPQKRWINVAFAPRKVRYLKLCQTLPSLWWSISELRFYSSGESETGASLDS